MQSFNEMFGSKHVMLRFGSFFVLLFEMLSVSSAVLFFKDVPTNFVMIFYFNKFHASDTDPAKRSY